MSQTSSQPYRSEDDNTIWLQSHEKKKSVTLKFYIQLTTTSLEKNQEDILRFTQEAYCLQTFLEKIIY